MFQRVRIAGPVLPENLPKIQSQDLPSFLYAIKRCSSRSDHRLCLLVLECPCSTSLKHPSSSLLDSGSLSLKPPSSSLLGGSLLHDARALVSTSLPFWGRVHVTSTWLQSAFAVDRVALPNESWDEVYWLKPVKRNEWCSISLIVKSSIFPTWPILSMSWASWPKETPRPLQPSRSLL
jgi:hypothetical protein